MKTTKLFLAAFVMMATMGFVACGDEDKTEPSTPDPVQYTESSSLTIKYEGNAVAAGDTAIYTHTTGMPMMFFDVVNKTQVSRDVYFKVEMLEGPASMGSMGLCTDVCNNFTCPFIAPNPNRPFTIPAGGSNSFDLQFMGEEGSTAVYKMTGGIGQDLQDPQVIFLKVIL